MALCISRQATCVRSVRIESTNIHGQIICKGRIFLSNLFGSALHTWRYADHLLSNRHVRVHHVDKDKDDPQLREVLAQRPEGGSRGRRRRVGS